MQHIFLHLTLCTAIAKLPAETVVPVHVQLSYRTGDPPFDKTFRVTRGDGTQEVVEFDVDRNLYRLRIDVPKYECSASDFLDVLEGTNRTVTEKLADGPPAPETPVTLLAGRAPTSFSYSRPTFALFDKSLSCNQPVPAPLTAKVNLEYDQGGYYVWLYPDASLDAHAPVVVALRLRTPTGTAHYIHLPIAFPQPWGGWPYSIQFDVTEEMLDGLATEKTDTLLCLKLWSTGAH